MRSRSAGPCARCSTSRALLGIAASGGSRRATLAGELQKVCGNQAAHSHRADPHRRSFRRTKHDEQTEASNTNECRHSSFEATVTRFLVLSYSGGSPESVAENAARSRSSNSVVGSRPYHRRQAIARASSSVRAAPTRRALPRGARRASMFAAARSSSGLRPAVPSFDAHLEALETSHDR